MAGSNIRGITIEIDGNTSSLQKSLKEVDSSIKETQRSLKDVDKLLKLDPKNTELLTQKQKLLKDAIEETKKRISQLKDAQGQLAQGTSDWDAVQREIIETEQKLKGLEDQFKSFGSVSAQQLKATGSEIQNVGSKVKGAGQAMAPASAAAAGLVTGFVGSGVEAVKLADELATLSKQTNISTEDLQKMYYASEMIDVSTDDIVKSVRKMKNNMDSDSSAVKEAWDSLGVSVTDATGQMRPAIDVFYDTIEALSHVENETRRDQLANDLLGKSADDLAGIIDDGGASFRAYGDEAAKMNLILSGETIDSLTAIGDTMDQTQANMSASITAMGATVAEALEPVMQTVAEVINRVAEALRQMDPETAQLIVTIGLVVAAISPVLIIIGNLIITLGGVVSAVGKVVGALATLNPATALVIAAIAAVIAIGTALYQNWDTIKIKCAEFAAHISEKWAALSAFIKGNVEASIQDISNAWNTIVSTVTTLVTTIHDTMVEKWNAIKQAISDAVLNAKTAVSDNITAIKETITTNVSEAVEFLRGLPAQALQWGRDLISNFVNGIKEKISMVTDVISGVAEDIADFLGFSEPEKGPLSNFHTFAPDMMRLYSEGIRDNMHLVSEQMNALADNMATAMQRPASIYLTNNTVLNGRVIASAVNEELGFML